MTRALRASAPQAPTYVTTAIPYVNGPPHLGFALELIQADVLARGRRALGQDVRFLTGSDENSLKNVLAAERQGLAPADLVARNAEAFRSLRGVLDLSFDDFIRTSSEARHRRGVSQLWRACAEAGDLYLRDYEGLYCVGCEQFYRPADLVEGLCPEHRTRPEPVAETNYFFRLSRYRDRLREAITSGRLEIAPRHRRSEVLRWIDGGLEDFSVSRSSRRARGWGLPVPGDPSQVIYVWFDALGNYITALDYGGDGKLLDRYWVGAGERIHLIGKGVSRFHALYWPALLLSAKLPLPTRLLIHGYVTVEGAKIGKSLGNAVDPVPVAAALGADALRYFLLRHIRAGEDGDVSRSRLEQAYRSELADQLGNLVSRTLGLVERYADGVVPHPSGEAAQSDALAAILAQLPARVGEGIERFAYHEALAAIWEAVAQSNRTISERAPWELARSGRSDRALRDCLYGLCEALQIIARALDPFLPGTATEIRARLGLDPCCCGAPLADRRVRRGPPLFPKDCIDRLPAFGQA